MKAFTSCVLLCFILTVTACSAVQNKDISDSLSENAAFNGVNNISITVPGIKKEHKIAVINDLHVIIPNDEVAPDAEANVNGRVQMFTNANGVTSKDAFQSLIDALNVSDVDAVLFGGDLIDFYSVANREFINAGLAKLEKPYIYVGADHDFNGYYTNSPGIAPDIAIEIEENPVYTLELDDITLLGINNSTSQLTESAEKQISDVLSKGKPVIVITHVPFEPVSDKGLGEASEKAWGDRKLYWGESAFYVPDEVTKRVINTIYTADNIKGVVAGHMHFRYDGMLTDKIPQHVTDAAYKGAPTVLTITGK